jgi:hypothetical protein
MPLKPRHSNEVDYLRSWEAFDRTFAAQPVTTRPTTPSTSSATYRRAYTPHARPMAPEPFATPGHSFASSSSWSSPVTPNDTESLDDVWDHVRKKKVLELQGQPSKVQSLETWSGSGDLPFREDIMPQSVTEIIPPRESLRRSVHRGRREPER